MGNENVISRTLRLQLTGHQQTRPRSLGDGFSHEHVRRRILREPCRAASNYHISDCFY